MDRHHGFEAAALSGAICLLKLAGRGAGRLHGCTRCQGDGQRLGDVVFALTIDLTPHHDWHGNDGEATIRGKGRNPVSRQGGCRICHYSSLYDGGTRLVLTHNLPESARASGCSALAGWHALLDQLAVLLDGQPISVAPHRWQELHDHYVESGLMKAPPGKE